tara:strand:- start:2524 stop:2733 length:210 start_codon:yes stop_codon:yes gene_type:complete
MPKSDETRGLTKRNLINALVLAVTAPTDKDCLKAIKLAESFASSLKKYEVKSCQLEAQRILNSIGLKAP